jgi:hypothetical protein
MEVSQMKRFILSVLVFGLISLFTGCANKVPEYSMSTNNVITLQGLSKDSKVNLNNFTDSGKDESKVMCRLATPIGTANGETFASYIENAFKKELLTAGMYDAESNINISANLDNIYGSTTLGNAYWEFEITVKSSNGTSYKVESRYDYESSYFGSSACSEMQRSFVPAVQKLIEDIIKHPKFVSLLI